MRIPESFRVVYDEQLAIIGEVRTRAERRLRVLCEDNGWLFDHRTKGPESVLAKLQLGELSSIEDMRDFYGAMVVLPTLADVDGAVYAIRRAFHTAERRERPPGDPEAFVYDDVHVIVTLGPLGPLDPTGLIGQRHIEVQVRTGLQYAWWKATHDVLYKGSNDWRLRRVAAELRAHLQSADRDLADLHGAAARIAAPDALDEDPEREAIARWQERWPPEARADDPRRFVETVRTYVAAADVSIADAERLLDDEAGRAHIVNAELTPAQAVLLTLVGARGVELLGALRAAGRRVFVTQEMEAVSPLLAALPGNDRVNLAVGSATVPAAPTATAPAPAGNAAPGPAPIEEP